MNMEKIICGIQQMGIGVPNVEAAWKWYRKFFGVNVKVFEEAADAPLMTRYTGEKVHSRTATLALSMEGGGGFEIWQFTSRPTEKASFDIKAGDFGLYICKIKSRNVAKSFEYFKKNGAELLNSAPIISPNGKATFFAKDPNGNIFQIVEGRGYFSSTGHPSGCGGAAGTIIGVSDIDKALPLYRDILGYDCIEYDTTGTFEDLQLLAGGEGQFRRVLLTHSAARKGPFARLLGPTEIELIQSIDRSDCRKIFENRFWGDWGFIHLCFDVQGMNSLMKECEDKGFPFTVDSSDTFDMGEAGGRFSYIEDPDGTWIEFVETHKVPVMKKLGWYINLKNKKPGKHLPNWMLKAMGLNKVKD
jgi:catechol 2,3-dioxygenase-like lactoylglutathione lyase family enzyme